MNNYFVLKKLFVDPSKKSYKEFKIGEVFNYAGIRFRPKASLIKLLSKLSWVELPIAFFVISIKYVLVLLRRTLTIQKQYEGELFFPMLAIENYREDSLLTCVKDCPLYFKIPFIRNKRCENTINILSELKYSQIHKSLWLSFITIFVLYNKYKKRDFFLRSYTTFEFFITCFFVENIETTNKIVHYSLIDRWAFLFCNAKCETFLIQHGKLMSNLELIKHKPSSTVYYISRTQKSVLDKVLFTCEPKTSSYRGGISFSGNNVLKGNGKKNVLVVCNSSFFDKEKKFVELLFGEVNLYLKPHPGEKDHSKYEQLKQQYGITILSKEFYPKVDIVISYDSTLADEYENVGITVIRHDTIQNCNEVESLIIDRNK